MTTRKFSISFYDRIQLTADKKGGWKMPFVPEKIRGVKLTHDILDAASGEVVAGSGQQAFRAPGEETRGGRAEDHSDFR